MNYHELANAMRGHAEAAAGRLPKPRMATVSSYNPSTHSVKVTFQGVGDSDVIETGWLPLGAVGVGNGFGVLTAPNIGDMVMIAFTDGSNAAPKVVGRFFSNVNVPPAVPAGETWIVHKSGSSLKFKTSGAVELVTASDLNATVGGALNANVTGAASVTSSASAAITAPTITLGSSGQTLLQFVTSAFMALFNGHTHTSAASGSPTSTPNQTMSASHMTSTVKGG
jgi:phage baseplate assembly protein gpV